MVSLSSPSVPVNRREKPGASRYILQTPSLTLIS